MNNQVQFVCFWCCVPLDFVVHMNNFISLVLLSAVIHKRRGKKLITKTIQYKLDSSLQFIAVRCNFPFFILKTFKNSFWKTIDFVENLEITQIAGDSCSLPHCDAIRTSVDM